MDKLIQPLYLSPLRLNFLELQLELVEEWRIRLTQLLSAGLDSLHVDSFLSPDATSHPVTAVINAAHHTMTVLLQWAHSLVSVYFIRKSDFILTTALNKFKYQIFPI